MGLLRYVLALSVVVFHSSTLFNLSMIGGRLAVQAFYMISGFYMFLILDRKYLDKKNAYTLFLSNRFLRLFPTYGIVLIISVLVSYFFYMQHDQNAAFSYYVNHLNQINCSSLIVLFFSNLCIIGQDIIHFLKLSSDGSFDFTLNFWQTEPKLFKFLFIPQAWTLSIELMFYAIVPFITRRRQWFLFTLVFFSFFARFMGYLNGYDHDPFNYRFFPFEIIFFILGGLSYRFYDIINDTIFKRKFLIWFSLILLFLIIVLYEFIPNNLFIFWFDYFVFPLKDYFFFALLFISIPVLFKLTEKNKVDRFIGELSYPLYIVHVLVISILIKSQIQGSLFSGSAILISTFLSILLVIFISKPIDRIRNKRLNFQILNYSNKPFSNDN